MAIMNNVFSYSFLFPSSGYFFPRMGCPRVLTFCMGHLATELGTTQLKLVYLLYSAQSVFGEY